MNIGQYLQVYFKCKKPFRKKALRVYECDDIYRNEYLTKAGNKAYGNFIDYLYKLDNLIDELQLKESITKAKSFTPLVEKLTAKKIYEKFNVGYEEFFMRTFALNRMLIELGVTLDGDVGNLDDFFDELVETPNV